jgi:hypothetical protein
MSYRSLKSPEDRLISALTNAICLTVRANGGIRIRNPISYLSYDISDLRTHLESKFESWMDWDNWGPYTVKHRTWQIDHILPQSLFPFDDLPHPNFNKCWALSNLRPLESTANMSKGKKTK